MNHYYLININQLKLKVDQIPESVFKQNNLLNHLRSINKIKLNIGIKNSQIPQIEPFNSFFIISNITINRIKNAKN